MVAVADGLALERRRVGSGLWLGKAKDRELLAAGRRLEILLLLLLAPPAEQHAGWKGVVHADHDRDGRVDDRDLLERDEIRQRIESHAVVLLGNHHPEETQLPEFRNERRLEVRVAIPCGAMRSDLLKGEILRDLLDAELFFSEGG